MVIFFRVYFVTSWKIMGNGFYGFFLSFQTITKNFPFMHLYMAGTVSLKRQLL